MADPTFVCTACGQDGVREGALCSKKCGTRYLILDRRSQFDEDRRVLFPSDCFDREADRRGVLARRLNDEAARCGADDQC